ncbi:MAG TPA: thiolase family protein [Methylomirabilota bacterium]|jgi:acetyl-CoA acetyltransferase|nr:thiolase family protein [Methylomirabilota bacterium]
MRQVAVIGAGMTRFGKHLDRSMKDLAREAIEGALHSAGVEKEAVEAAAVGNAVAGLITGQECIRGQVVLREMGIGGIPIINTENACASASTAFHLAWLYVASGMYDIVLAVGMEKLFHPDKKKTFQAIGSGIDVEMADEFARQMSGEQSAGAGESRSVFMDYYANLARQHMARYGTTREQFARIAAKNHTNGSLNPHAQFQTPRTLAEVLAAPLIAEPLTRMMCSPIGDGAAAVVVASAEKARRFTTRPVFVRASALGSNQPHRPEEPGVVTKVAQKAYAMAGIGPQDLHVIEVHDATAPAELFAYEELGLCNAGEGGKLIDEGVTALGGRMPVNPSGGLLAKGHPVGATGVAQIAEIFWQLRGEAGKRQAPGARVGLTENGGGVLDGENAAAAVHIFTV